MENGEKKVRAKFPAIGAINNKRFFEAEPIKETDEDQESFDRRHQLWSLLKDASLDIELVDRDTAIEWAHRFDLWLATENKRKLDLEREGKPVPSGLTREGTIEIRTIHFEVVSRCVAKVHQMEFGNVLSESVIDRSAIARLLDSANLLADASRLAREAQRPTPAQSES